MSLSMFHAVCLGLLALGVSSCDREPESAADQHADPPSPGSEPAHRDEAEHEELPQRVRLDPAVIRDARIQTAPVVREVLASTIDLPGEVASDPDRTARVSALLPGRIDAVLFREGQAVKKGDLLVRIKVPELGKAKASLAATAARASAARTNADRLHALSEKRLAANQEVLAAKAEADALTAEARAAEEQLAALGTSLTGSGNSELALRAPVTGIVISRNAVVGQPVAAEQMLATIADLSEVWFLGSVFEKSLAKLRIGAAAEVQLNAYPEQRFAGTVDYLSQQIDPTARTITARIRLANRDDLLRLGLFGVARVDTGDEAKNRLVLVVPRSAVTDIGQKQAVFVRQPDGDFDVHEVVLGESALGKVEIVSGLREGEQVVVEGVFTLKSAVLKSTFGEDDE
jgi:cobalt-zinc-cadmium efflux system membrane fusion protein